MYPLDLFGGSNGLNREDILKRLEMFCNELKPGGRIIVVGASSIILNLDDQTDRFTVDIDILNTIKSNSYSKYDIQVVNEGILFLCDDYKVRLKLQNTFNGIRIFSLGSLDIALSKLGRGLEKDKADIRLLISSGQITIETFQKKYKEFRDGYGGSARIIDDNYYSITGIIYPQDKKMFD